MGKRKSSPLWAVLLQGVATALGIYLLGAALLALALVRGAVPESGAFGVTAALCLLAALGGGLTVARRTPWGTLPAALVNTGLFAFVLTAVSYGCWQGITGQGWVLLLCALAGGVLSALVSGRRKKRSVVKIHKK